MIRQIDFLSKNWKPRLPVLNQMNTPYLTKLTTTQGQLHFPISQNIFKFRFQQCLGEEKKKRVRKDDSLCNG